MVFFCFFNIHALLDNPENLKPVSISTLTLEMTKVNLIQFLEVSISRMFFSPAQRTPPTKSNFSTEPVTCFVLFEFTRLTSVLLFSSKLASPLLFML